MKPLQGKQLERIFSKKTPRTRHSITLLNDSFRAILLCPWKAVSQLTVGDLFNPPVAERTTLTFARFPLQICLLCKSIIRLSYRFRCLHVW